MAVLDDLYRTTAKLNFYVAPPPGVHAYQIAYPDPNSTEPDRNWTLAAEGVVIENLRGKGDDTYTLNTAGFQLVNQPAKYTTFTDDAEIERLYYPESVDLIKEVTGASRVVFFDHTIRRRRPGQSDQAGKRQPSLQVHVDQSTAAAIARVHRTLPPDEVPGLLRRRFQIINLWRPISHPAIDWPLALCDYRSVAPEDTFPVTKIYPKFKGETLGVQYNPSQEWKFFHGVTPDEAILIKCFDSIQDGSVAVFAPHTAFEDPNTPTGTPPRQSIELRALVFYD